MKHLDGEQCFMELTKGDCLLLAEYLTHSINWYKEHNITGEVYSINEYIKKFRSFYGQQLTQHRGELDKTSDGLSSALGSPADNYSPITIKKELDRR